MVTHEFSVSFEPQIKSWCRPKYTKIPNGTRSEFSFKYIQKTGQVQYLCLWSKTQTWTNFENNRHFCRFMLLKKQKQKI